jgi:hypothetical protein
MPILFLHKRYAALSAETILASELLCQKNYACSSSSKTFRKNHVITTHTENQQSDSSKAKARCKNKASYHQHRTIAETQTELKEKLAAAHDATE